MQKGYQPPVELTVNDVSETGGTFMGNSHLEMWRRQDGYSGGRVELGE